MKSVHLAIKNLFFDENLDDVHVGNILVNIGWIYTISVTAIHVACKLRTPYGKHLNKNTKGYKFLSSTTVNPRLGWTVQELPAFALPMMMLREVWSDCNWAQVALLAMFLLHYFNRSFVFPHLISQGKGVPVVIVLLAAPFCAFNGYLQAHWILYVVPFRTDEVFKPPFALGCALYLFGMLVNLDSDRRLRQLRKPLDANKNDDDDEERRYKIPRGGFFEYVSSANYFGEICEWWGYALAARLTQGPLLFAAFTTLFLGIRGVHNHIFYLERFGSSYPPDRKAVLPFIV